MSKPKLLTVPEYKSVKEVKLPAKGTALIVVDMQNDFAHPEGSLYVPSTKSAIPAIARLLKKARRGGATVVFTQDWHAKEDPEFKIWPVHAVAGTWGAEIIRELQPGPDEPTVKKLRYDAFYGTPLEHLLRLKNIQSLVFCGTVSNICVLHTAGSSALRWFQVVMPIDACAALNEFDQQSTIRQVSFLYQGIITTSDGVKFQQENP